MNLRTLVKLVEVVMNCLNCIYFSVLWNGEETEPFPPSHGVRQGDPLSLYLFVPCMERLNHIIEDAINQGNWKIVTASRGEPSLVRLFFADDLVLFGEAALDQTKVIKKCLDLFFAASGESEIAKIHDFLLTLIRDSQKVLAVNWTWISLRTWGDILGCLLSIVM